MLLDGYHITDQGVHEGIRRETAQGRTLACARGCAACCRAHLTIPVYPLELIGIYWYTVEKTRGGTREKLHRQLANYEQGAPCPFLVDEVCAMRPMACRQFNVFDKVCEEGEDADYSRPHDVSKPLMNYTERAFFTMLPFYGVRNKGERRRALKKGMRHTLARVLQEQDWPKFTARMAVFDRKSLVNN